MRARAGKRMLLGDWTECPACACPANMAPFVRVLDAQRQCPLCGGAAEAGQLRRVRDPLALLESMANKGTLDGGAESSV